jgi:hypothetical protein
MEQNMITESENRILVEAVRIAAEQIESLKEKLSMTRAQALIRKDLIEKLKSGPGGIMEMKQTIADLETEIERLTKKCDMQANILRRLTPDKFPDTLFISGVLGERDSNNMPQKLLVVPAYGVDFSYIYERTEKTTGPEW